jgi:hypothetical protein
VEFEGIGSDVDAEIGVDIGTGAEALSAAASSCIWRRREGGIMSSIVLGIGIASKEGVEIKVRRVCN